MGRAAKAQRRRGQSDLIAILEAAYARAENRDAWLASVLEALNTFYLGGEGCFGYFFERTGPLSLRFGSHALAGLPDQYHRMLHIALGGETPEFVEAMYNCPPVTTLSRVMPIVGDRPRFQNTRFAEEMNQWMVLEKKKDQLGMRAEDGSGHGVMLVAPLPRVERLERREIATLMRILAHVAAGNRLLRATTDAKAEAEAILRPDGRIDHAVGVAKEPPARKSLALAAARIDRARGRLRRLDADAAVEAWRALVAGRWSLVDHFDSDGRRYLFARRNEQHPRWSKKVLSARERQVAALAALGHANKLIAYELGLQVSTVSAYLASVFAKLGVSSRLELVRAMSPGTPGDS